MSVLASLVERFAALLEPLFHASAAAAAIILLTALVRLLVHPLSRASARGQKARKALQPKIAELNKKHGKDPERLQKAVLELHAKEQVSPLAGCLPSLVQLPVFFVLFHLFSRPAIGGEPNGLLEHELLAAPLGKRWTDALGDGGLFGPAGLVYLGLFALVAVVAWFGYRQGRRTLSASVPAAPGSEVPGLGAVTRVMPYLSFFTLVSVAVVPLAAALYIVTSTAWGAAERALLHR
ncbi:MULTISPECIES: YidC/Oxa1 family membrane protein insertase [unclassified Streptomyces]|uniref:YidC/Oxa1 family membrane protein insertase n=1 Tax=unclassified Streptomyces TaxID=2593676 RepID=UPI000DD79BA2|nr:MULTISPECIES: YidC/Oxa1 family membrane protein insertase [unclassified Streptomyces]QZZ28026.1 YidC/Oxa1 family membrane protein insertase [Streptomyces sp. ST1015]